MPSRLCQAQENIQRKMIDSGLERSDKKEENRPTWPCDRAVLNPS